MTWRILGLLALALLYVVGFAAAIVLLVVL